MFANAVEEWKGRIQTNIYAMATNTCNQSFPRLEIEVPMPWSEWYRTYGDKPSRGPKSYFWDILHETTE